MANRFQVNEYELAYKFIKARDGEQCLVCQRKASARLKLEIDHADGDKDNDDPDNLHFLCRKDNLAKRQMTSKEQKKMIDEYCAVRERERERARGIESTEVVKAMVDYKSASPEMQVNSYCETSFRDWVLTNIKKAGSISKREIVNSGAEVVGCSTVTTARYLSKMTGSVGILTEGTDGMGIVVIKFKR